MKKGTNAGIILFFIVLAALYIAIYAVPNVAGFFDVTYVAEYGELSVYDETDAWFIRNETVYTAPDGGSVRRLADEGALLRKGTQVVAITAGAPGEDSEEMDQVRERLGGQVQKTTMMQGSGLISYFVDGYEGTLTPDYALTCGYDLLSEIREDQVVKIPSVSTREGDPVFKSIKNDRWYLIIFVPEDHASRYRVGKTCYLVPPDDEGHDMGEVQLRVESVDMDGEQAKVVMSSRNYFDRIGELRCMKVKIITSEHSGLLVRNSSIVEKDGKTGVYIKDTTGKYVFVRVNVLDSDDEQSVVSASSFYDEEGEYVYTIDPFEDVLSDPSIQEEEGDEDVDQG